MRYIIIGAGAVGGTIGGCLALAGHEVVLTARGAHLDALRRHGLRLSTPSGTDEVGENAAQQEPEGGRQDPDAHDLEPSLEHRTARHSRLAGAEDEKGQHRHRDGGQ